MAALKAPLMLMEVMAVIAVMAVIVLMEVIVVMAVIVLMEVMAVLLLVIAVIAQGEPGTTASRRAQNNPVVITLRVLQMS